MNFSVFNVVLFGGGGILIYAAVKGVDPRDVVRNTLQGKPLPGKSAASTPANNGAANKPGGSVYNSQVPRAGRAPYPSS